MQYLLIKIDLQLLQYLKMKIVLIMMAVISIGLGQIFKDMPTVTIKSKYQPVQKVNVAPDKVFIFQFQQIGFQVGSKLLIANFTDIDNNNLFSPDSYKLAKNCIYNKVDFTTKEIRSHSMSFYTNYHYVSTRQSKVYIGNSQKQLAFHHFNESLVVQDFLLNLSHFDLNKNNQFKIFQLGADAYLTDSQKLIRLPQSPLETTKLIDNFIPPVTQTPVILKIQQLPSSPPNSFFIIRHNSLQVLSLIQDKIIQKFNYSPKDQRYVDGLYDQASSHFYLLSFNKLSIYKNQKNIYSFNLEGTCSSIKKYYKIIHIMCEIQKKDFIAQYFLTQKSGLPFIILNRYYNDFESTNDVIYLGNGKQLMVGDDEAVIISQPLSKNTLREAEKKQSTFIIPISQPFLKLVYIPKLSNSSLTTILVITVDRFFFLEIKQQHPFATCSFDSSDFSQSLYIAGYFNVSHCKSDQMLNPQIVSSLQTICSHWKIFQVDIIHQEYDHKSALLIGVLIVLLALILTFFFVGCGLKRIQQVRNAVRKSAYKLKLFKEKTNPKPI